MSAEGAEGSRLGPFTLERKLGEGGMAVTWLAREHLEGIGGERRVAVKQILPHFAGDVSFREMFLDEARLSTQLNHQNICRVFHAGQVEGSLYISMEYIEGSDLWRLMLRAKGLEGGFPMAHALYITEQVLYGLHAAHTAKGPAGEPLGLVHRDVSPQNVLVSRDGEVKVIDFGVAKARTNSSKTATGVVKGKVLYYSPEQLESKPLDGRSDLFAVGLMLYEMLTGVHPLEGESDVQTIYHYYRLEIDPPSKHNPACEGLLDELVMRALSRAPGDRFESADEMAQEVAEARFETYPSYKPALLKEFLSWSLDGDQGVGYQMPESRSSGKRGSGGGQVRGSGERRGVQGSGSLEEGLGARRSGLTPPPSPFEGPVVGAARSAEPRGPEPRLEASQGGGAVGAERASTGWTVLWYVVVVLLSVLAAGCLSVFGLAFLGAMAQ